MKRLIMGILSFLLIGTSVFAEGSISANNENGFVRFNKEAWMNERVVLSWYDDNGVLSYSNIYTAEDNIFKIEVPHERSDMSVRAYFVGNNDIKDVAITVAAPEPIPTNPPVPTASPEPKYPSIYKTESNAIHAFAVVEKVSTAYIDDEDWYIVTALYQGKEIDFKIPVNVTFSAASSEFSSMIGQDASALRKGDVFHYSAALFGNIKDLHFIYRPLKQNIVFQEQDYGKNFEELISSNGVVAGQNGWVVSPYGNDLSAKNQFALGIVANKTQNSVILLNKSGNMNDAQRLSIKNDTIVYVCDMSSSRNSLEIGHISDIVSTFPLSVTAKHMVEFTDEYSYTYALARIIDGIVTDIILYTNY